jgi:mono/diheme cytochrome c family protein
MRTNERELSMNAAPQPVDPRPLELPQEPEATRRPAPVWLFVVMFILLYWGMVFVDRRGGEFSPQVYLPYHTRTELQKYQPSTGGNLERGKAVFESVCAPCHNSDGMGKPNQAPPFVSSEWALGSPARMIRIPLAGLNGPVKVKDQEWNLSMPAMGAALPDEDLAAVLSYIRQSWGNKASAITPEQVKAVRAEIGTPSQGFTAEQLNAVP